MLAEGWHHLNSSEIWPRVRDIAWSSSEQIVAFAATMYIKRCGRQLLEKCWSVWESYTAFKVSMPWPWKNANNHGTFTAKVVKSVFILLAMRGYNILYSNWGEKIVCSSVHCVKLTFVYSAQKYTLFRTVNYDHYFNCCQLVFISLLFVALLSYKNILTMKFSQITVFRST